MLLSIIIPVYNIKNYINKCIESIINQDVQSIEVILVDDGSTDSSGNICDKYLLVDKRINVIHKANGGLSSARNAGLNSAKGDYYMFVDGDDYLLPNSLKMLFQCVKDYDDCDFIQYSYLEVNDDSYNKPVKYDNIDIRFCSNKIKMFQNLYEIGGCAVSSCSKIYKKHIFDKLRFKENIIHEDEYIIPYVLDAADKCAYIDVPIYCYVKREGSIINSKFNKSKMDICISIDDRREFFNEKGLNILLEQEDYREFGIYLNLFCNTFSNGYKDEYKEISRRINELLHSSNSKKLRIDKKASLIKQSCVFLVLYAIYRRFKTNVRKKLIRN